MAVIRSAPVPRRLWVTRAAPHVLVAQEVAGRPATVEWEESK